MLPSRHALPLSSGTRPGSSPPTRSRSIPFRTLHSGMRPDFSRPACVVRLLCLFALAFPAVAAAHAELDTATPPDGAVVSGAPRGDRPDLHRDAGSGKELADAHDGSGAEVARAGGSGRRHRNAAGPAIAWRPGPTRFAGRPRRTTATSARTLHFELTAPTPSPTALPTPATPTAAPAASPRHRPLATPAPLADPTRRRTGGIGTDQSPADPRRARRHRRPRRMLLARAVAWWRSRVTRIRVVRLGAAVAVADCPRRVPRRRWPLAQLDL